ncbi:hypothetical protein OHD62_26755 [Mesorhizobium sp. YC-39]|uniref:hypothetical protein n=1 Tax=unclassified Mesorhizobium TaxID=325217 RepID=UPI0021E7AB9C|nr:MULTISPECIES: hypothetical protein [unclassified Mesorhizobium]MCV3208661.1 hypothetical protein [Mesorhizobium sp. YC-2]MCV3231990.1 hypothetical protein [Mesorhizobium sp. YC-39]
MFIICGDTVKRSRNANAAHRKNRSDSAFWRRAWLDSNRSDPAAVELMAIQAGIQKASRPMTFIQDSMNGRGA